jgi:hypothetical protein
MFGEEFHGGGRANFDLFQAPAFQGSGRPFFQRVTQPAADGHRDAALAPLHDAIRQVTLGLYALPAGRAITGLITSEEGLVDGVMKKNPSCANLYNKR